MKKVLLIIDNINEKTINELRSAANEMYDEYKCYAYCVQEVNNVKMSGLDYLLKSSTFIAEYDTLNIVNFLNVINEKYNFDSILIQASYFGRMIAPSLAMKLDVGLVADVTSITKEEDKIVMVRPAFDGKIFAGIVSDKEKPIMMSVRTGVFKSVSNYSVSTELIIEDFMIERSSSIKQVSSIKKPPASDIRDSEIIVSGGNGTSNYFDKLSMLADALNGMVGASRKIIDQNKATREIQVGQSGKIVSPKLYIAIGIYGSLQHIEGLNDVKYLISVNTNKHAPICSLADIVVEGDGLEFINMLTDKINKER